MMGLDGRGIDNHYCALMERLSFYDMNEVKFYYNHLKHESLRIGFRIKFSNMMVAHYLFAKECMMTFLGLKDVRE